MNWVVVDTASDGVSVSDRVLVNTLAAVSTSDVSNVSDRVLVN